MKGEYLDPILLYHLCSLPSYLVSAKGQMSHWSGATSALLNYRGRSLGSSQGGETKLGWIIGISCTGSEEKHYGQGNVCGFSMESFHFCVIGPLPLYTVLTHSFH